MILWTLLWYYEHDYDIMNRWLSYYEHDYEYYEHDYEFYEHFYNSDKNNIDDKKQQK